jgi:hypothetical protein
VGWHWTGRWGKLEVHRSVDEATLQRLLDVLERRRVETDVRRIFVLMLSAQDDDNCRSLTWVCQKG